MRWLSITMLITGASAVAGGVGFTFLQSYNVFSMQMWQGTLNLMLNHSEVFFNELSGGGDLQNLMRGFLSVVIGICILGLLALSWSFVILFSFAVRMVRRIRSAAVRSTKKGEVNTHEPTKAPFMSRVRLPKISFGGRGEDVFQDADANLEQQIGEGLLSKLKKNLSGAMKSKRNIGSQQVIVSSGGTSRVIAEISQDLTFYSDLKSWHARVKKSSGTDLGLVDDAKILNERMTKAVADAVADEDPMNGHFLMRMLTAWADKTQAPIVSPAVSKRAVVDDETTLIQAAINDVIANGVSDDDNGEDRVDLDDDKDGFLPSHLFEGLDDDTNENPLDVNDIDVATSLLSMGSTEDRDVDLDDDEEAPFLDQSLFAAEGDDDTSDDNSRAPNGEDDDRAVASESDEVSVTEDHFGTLIMDVFNLKASAEQVAEGMSEWPEELQTAQQRIAVLEQSMTALMEAVECANSATLSTWIDDNSGTSQWDWFDGCKDSLEEERNAILEVIAGDDVDEDTSDDGDEIDGFDVTTNAFASIKKPEPTILEPAVIAPVVEDVEPSEDLQNVDSEDAGDDVEESGGAPATSEDDTLQDGAKEDSQEIEVAAIPTPIEEPVEIAPEPQVRAQNVSLGELEEVEACDELLTKWGYAARAAGASDAKIVSTVVSKIGVKRKVEGVLHMTATWRDAGKGEQRRINLIFRHVPEGTWKLDVGEDIRLVDDQENFVLVRGSLLNHVELKDQTTVIHFFGDGVSEEISGEPMPGVHLVSKVLNSEEIKQIVFK